MATVDKIVKMLRDRQLEFARSNLSIPNGKKGFDYGVACGTYLAYEQMSQDIDAMLEQEAANEKRRENEK